MINKKKIMMIVAIIISAAALIGIFISENIKSNKTTQVVGGSVLQLELEEEIIPEVKEEVISVRQDTTIDESLAPKQEEEKVVTVADKKVAVPKSTVAPVNSSEDAETNKKTGGEAVTQEQANTMFENVGTKSFGIDVSAHQGKIDWAAVKKAGVDFAIIRCGFRGQSQGGIYEDAYFKKNVSGATANGIKVGIYFYSTAINENEALEEAAWVISKIKTYRITYPVVYDFEDFGSHRCVNVDGAQATKNAHTFLNLVKQAGYEPMMYANKSDITSRLSRSSFSCKFWLAHYTTQTDYKGSYNMWQYTSRGSVDGIKGNVDMNIAYFSYGATAEPKHTHDYSEVVKGSEKKATCTTDGSTTKRCSCGESITETIEKLGHKYGEWEIVKKATTKEEGQKKRVCSVCKNEEIQVIEKLKETENIANTNKNENKVNNTNTSKENTTNTTNTTENKVDIEENKHTEHEYVEISRTDATCTTDGKINKKCTGCELTTNETISSTGHKFLEGKCSVCGEKDPNYVEPEIPKNEAEPEVDSVPDIKQNLESEIEQTSVNENNV